ERFMGLSVPMSVASFWSCRSRISVSQPKSKRGPYDCARRTTMSYQTTVRESAAIRVAALAHRGDYAEISRTFQELAAVATDKRLFSPTTRLFAIYYDSPSTTHR